MPFTPAIVISNLFPTTARHRGHRRAPNQEAVIFKNRDWSGELARRAVTTTPTSPLLNYINHFTTHDVHCPHHGLRTRLWPAVGRKPIGAATTMASTATTVNNNNNHQQP